MAELAEIEHRELRSAIEFAVAIAEEANKRKLSMPYPRELRAQFGKQRVPNAQLGRLRRAIEADDVFRERIALGAVDELVDEVGMLWLRRPANWEADALELIESVREQEQEADLQVALRRAEKRRAGAEKLATRTRAEMVDLQATIELQRTEIDMLRADVTKAEDAIVEMRAEVIDVRNEARHARDREAAANDKLDAARAELDAIRRHLPADDDRNRAGDAAAEPTGVDPAAIAEAVGRARALVEHLEALDIDPAEPAERSRRARRRAMRLPGGVIASSAEAAQFLLVSDAVVLIDGYNVAKLGWPALSLERQREALLDGVENLAGRFGTDITVVFDGASVVGAHSGRRRLTRVVYSPAGVTADDVIRDEVARLPASRHVVVVTNDREIVDDVRAAGANVVPSNALLAVT